MIKIIAKKDFASNIGSYIAGDEIKNATYRQIVRLNELGFIEPLNFKDLITIKREMMNPTKDLKIKEEEE